MVTLTTADNALNQVYLGVVSNQIKTTIVVLEEQENAGIIL